MQSSGLHIRKGKRDHLGIVFYILSLKVMSLEQSRRDDSNEGSHSHNVCFYGAIRNKENYPEIIPVTPSYLDHCLH